MKKVNIEKIMITEDDGDVNVKMLLWELAMIANMYFKYRIEHVSIVASSYISPLQAMYEDLEGLEPPPGVSFLHSLIHIVTTNCFTALDQRYSKKFQAYLSQQPNYDPRKSGEKKASNDKENVPKKRNAIFR